MGAKTHEKQAPKWDFAEPGTAGVTAASMGWEGGWQSKSGWVFPWKGCKNTSAGFGTKTLTLSSSLGIRPEATSNFPVRYPSRLMEVDGPQGAALAMIFVNVCPWLSPH